MFMFVAGLILYLIPAKNDYIKYVMSVVGLTLMYTSIAGFSLIVLFLVMIFEGVLQGFIKWGELFNKKIS